MVKLENRSDILDGRKEEDIPLVERILLKTSDPKVATVLALDLLLVGIDTVSESYFKPKNDGRKKKKIG